MQARTGHLTHTGENTMTDININAQLAAALEQIKQYVPKITPSANGYEIRTKVLQLAQEHEWNNWNASWGQFEASTTVKNGEFVATVSIPKIPAADTVLETARKFYEFVNQNPKK